METLGVVVRRAFCHTGVAVPEHDDLRKPNHLRRSLKFFWSNLGEQRFCFRFVKTLEGLPWLLE